MADNPGSAAAANAFRSVDAGIAVEHGLPAAFVHHQIGRWCAYNKAEGIDAVLIDGAHWMYISHERLKAALPWYDVRTIRRAIETLNRAQLLHKRLRKGTETERSGSPAALLYRAIKYVDAGVDRMSRGGGQNVQVGGGQNVHVEYVNLEQVKKSTDLKDQTTSAKARSKEAAISRERVKARSKTKPQRVPYAQNEHRVRSTDGFKPIGQVINKRPTCPQLPPPIERPLSAWWIRIDQEEKAAEAAAQAAEAAEQEKGLIAGLRDLVIYHLDHLPLPQELRETLEAAILEEYSPTFDGWDIDALNAWVKQLLAIQTKLKPQPKAETVAEAAG